MKMKIKIRFRFVLFCICPVTGTVISPIFFFLVLIFLTLYEKTIFCLCVYL